MTSQGQDLPCADCTLNRTGRNGSACGALPSLVSVVVIIVEIGSHEAIARVSSEGGLKPESAFRFEVMMGGARLFDRETGMRL